MEEETINLSDPENIGRFLEFPTPTFRMGVDVGFNFIECVFINLRDP